MRKNLYVEVWQKYLPAILEIITPECEDGDLYGEIKVSKELLTSVGNRKSYNFSLEYAGFDQLRNISNSAVARDLDLVLRESDEFVQILSWHRVYIFFHNFTLMVRKDGHVTAFFM